MENRTMFSSNPVGSFAKQNAAATATAALVIVFSLVSLG